MQKFATEFENYEFLQHDVSKLSWNHNRILLDKMKEKNRKWYVIESVENGWARPVIIHQIASKLYERQAFLENKTTKQTGSRLINIPAN